MAKTKLATGNNVIELAQKSQELEAYIVWRATPREFREPSSQAKLSKVLHVTERTLSNWSKDPRVITRVRAASLSMPLLDALPDITESIVSIASDPSHPRAVSAAKVYFELLASQSEVEQVVDISEMSISELKQHAADLYDALDEADAKKTKQA